MRHTHSRSLRVGASVSLRRFHLSKSIALWLLAFALNQVGAHGQTLTLTTPQDLLAMDPTTFVQLLETARPGPVSAEDKAHGLRSLPEQGEVTSLTGSALRKLAALRIVLRKAERDSVYEIKVIDVPQAAVALYARAVVLISGAALALLSAEELQAQIAHEIGHEYVWLDYERARSLADHQRLKDLELLCDAIAIVTLRRLGIDHSRLIAGLEKISRFNRERLGTADNESAYPTLSERRAYARAIAMWTATVRNSSAGQQQRRARGAGYFAANSAGIALSGRIWMSR